MRSLFIILCLLEIFRFHFFAEFLHLIRLEKFAMLILMFNELTLSSFPPQAFVGVAEDLKAIIIAFRGTQQARFVFCCCLGARLFLENAKAGSKCHIGIANLPFF